MITCPSSPNNKRYLIIKCWLNKTPIIPIYFKSNYFSDNSNKINIFKKPLTLKSQRYMCYHTDVPLDNVFPMS